MTKVPAILIVDDDEATRRLWVKVIEAAGYDATSAATFEDARQLLDAQPFDLLITDLRLGAFNGLQLLVRKPIPTVVVTGYFDPVMETEAKHLGAAFLLKPVSPVELLRAVNEKLDARPEIAFAHLRRWARKPLAAALEARADQAPARVVDVSYGGVRFEVPEDAEIPPSFDMSVPERVAVHLNLVWESRTGGGTRLCGAALSQVDIPTATAWHGFVDSLA